MPLSADARPEDRGVVAGQDDPRTYHAFVTLFPDDEACVRYIERLRWPAGFVCSACGNNGGPWRASRERRVCPACHKQVRLGAGTLFDKTRTPLTAWFEAAWHMTTAKNGRSAKTLERTLGTSDRVAWTILQRYRVARVRAQRERLDGNVEVDETLVGGVEPGGKRGRGCQATPEVDPLATRRIAPLAGHRGCGFVVDGARPDEARATFLAQAIALPADG